MDLKIGVLVILIFLIASVSSLAYGCEMRAESECLTSPWNNILFRVSDMTNAHAETYDQANYGYVVCCNFSGTRNCDEDNIVIRLSYTTNAHAEVPDLPLPIYTTQVCYENLICFHTSEGCEGNQIPIASLSDITNAHVAEYGTTGYDIDICCVNTNEQTGVDCDLSSATWSTEQALEGEKVYLNVTGDLDCVGATISFEVFDEEDNEADETPFSTTFDEVDGEIIAQGEWTAEYGDNPNYYFIASVLGGEGISSGTGSGSIEYLEVSESGFFCTDYILCNSAETEDECIFANTCASTIDNSASNYNLGDQLCGNDECDPPSTNTWFDACACEWNDENESCEFVSTEKDCALGLDIGTCEYITNETSDCDEQPIGSYFTSWLGNWVWGNTYTEEECLVIGEESECIEDPIESGDWHYDPSGSKENCKSGYAIIKCVENTMLPFFNKTNFLLSLIGIFLIYGILLRNKSFIK